MLAWLVPSLSLTVSAHCLNAEFEFIVATCPSPYHGEWNHLPVGILNPIRKMKRVLVLAALAMLLLHISTVSMQADDEFAEFVDFDEEGKHLVIHHRI